MRVHLLCRHVRGERVEFSRSHHCCSGNLYFLLLDPQMPFPSGLLTLSQLTIANCLFRTFCLSILAADVFNTDMTSAFPQIKVVDKGEGPVEKALMQKVESNHDKFIWLNVSHI